ncbi:hypothetical protein ACSBR2_035830 [Camellia fascicularis]
MVGKFWEQILDYLGKSSDTDSSSPVEYLCSCRSSRKALIYLILTLYHMYPDYDFSAVKAHQFFMEESWDSFKQIFDAYMFEASKKSDGASYDSYDFVEANEGSPLLDTLYRALDEVVKLAECEIYSYNPDSDSDPFLEKGAIWSFTFFFYNRKLKRVVSFRFSCLSNLVAEGFLTDGVSYKEDGEIFDDMDVYDGPSLHFDFSALSFLSCFGLVPLQTPFLSFFDVFSSCLV